MSFSLLRNSAQKLRVIDEIVGGTATQRSELAQIVDRTRSFWVSHGVDASASGNNSILLAINGRATGTHYLRSGPGNVYGREAIEIGNDAIDGFIQLSDSIFAHEWGHRITNAMRPEHANFAMHNHGKVVNEHIADAFSALATGQTEISTPTRVIRSMTNPGDHRFARTLDDGSTVLPSSTWSEYSIRGDGDVPLSEVYRNVGIPNRAGAQIIDQLGVEATTQLYLDTVRHRLTGHTDVPRFASSLLESARQIHGDNSSAARKVLEAWRTTGIDAAEITATTPSLPKRTNR